MAKQQTTEQLDNYPTCKNFCKFFPQIWKQILKCNFTFEFFKQRERKKGRDAFCHYWALRLLRRNFK